MWVPKHFYLKHLVFSSSSEFLFILIVVAASVGLSPEVNDFNLFQSLSHIIYFVPVNIFLLQSDLISFIGAFLILFLRWVTPALDIEPSLSHFFSGYFSSHFFNIKFESKETILSQFCLFLFSCAAVLLIGLASPEALTSIFRFYPCLCLLHPRHTPLALIFLIFSPAFSCYLTLEIYKSSEGWQCQKLKYERKLWSSQISWSSGLNCFLL